MYEGKDAQVLLHYWEDKVFIHCKVNRKKWGVSLYKKLYVMLQHIGVYLKEMGYTKVHSLIPDNDDKLYKFQLMFGFTSEYSVNGAILLSRNL